MNIFKTYFQALFKKKEKKILNPGVIGFYDCKPFDNFYYSLIYAKENPLKDEKDLKIFTRTYKNTTFINVLVYDETGFDIEKNYYEHFQGMLKEKNLEAAPKSIVMVLFQHNNEHTQSMCKKFYQSDKNHFVQACVYNPKDVQMDYYKPVPEFYRLYDIFCEDIYFDLGCYDASRR